ncbi:zinc ribbon domain-containing protein [Desulfosporosinus meridiei]|uniref:Zinc-ribbon domain-containing protein n=1 Tax=Desulfosporosinus meridiei (strain ATCC BAA-275 / DSM 13257 / KCTC 12902 / NCIMB 13706 / S10) TaxID=768704 RepID=J7IUJ2_DESMD|nr:zinc ribbon domain-containing protein [Desulfosporosinus meridiei]AFQ42356.1 hypothetical protein Desmer_0294 [Desulfosporosinus meridiei DSM 13257]
MIWPDRMKSAWVTFKREALPLYGWTLILAGAFLVLLIAVSFGILNHLNWVFPNIHNFQGAYSYSAGMPVPGMPPVADPFTESFIDPFTNPFTDPFSPPFELPFSYFGGIENFSRFIPFIESIVGSLLFILIVIWLVGATFYTGISNLTMKAYREKVSFRDFRFRGFFRILGWQAFVFLIQLLIVVSGLVAVFVLRQSEWALVSFLIAYALFLLVIGLFTLPWIISSGIYLLAHPELSFPKALSRSWSFFRSHMGTLWGYLGTVFLIEIAIEILNRISPGTAGLVYFVISPFTVVLAIVWVLSIEDDERERAWQVNQLYNSVSDPISQTLNFNPSITDAKEMDASRPNPPKPKLDLQKSEHLPSLTEDNPRFCPSCGKPDTGTAYCPQCGTKLH